MPIFKKEEKSLVFNVYLSLCLESAVVEMMCLLLSLSGVVVVDDDDVVVVLLLLLLMMLLLVCKPESLLRLSTTAAKR